MLRHVYLRKNKGAGYNVSMDSKSRFSGSSSKGGGNKEVTGTIKGVRKGPSKLGRDSKRVSISESGTSGQDTTVDVPEELLDNKKTPLKKGKKYTFRVKEKESRMNRFGSSSTKEYVAEEVPELQSSLDRFGSGKSSSSSSKKTKRFGKDRSEES